MNDLTRAEQTVYIRKHYNTKTSSQIAKELGITKNVVLGIAYRNNIKKRMPPSVAARKKIPLTTAMRKEIIEMYSSGVTPALISCDLIRPQAEVKRICEAWKKDRTIEKKCMMCGNMFPSSGSGERVCITCKQKDDWKDGFNQYGGIY